MSYSQVSAMSAIINVAFTGRLVVFLSKFENLRQVIRSKTGLNVEIMRILHEGREMNQDTIDGIDNPDFSLIIRSSNKEIIAQLENGDTVTIPISWDKKVADVKKWLDDKLAIEYNNMSLSYQGVRLQDEIVLATYFGDVIIARVLVTKINKKEVVLYVDCRREGFESEVVRVAVQKTETVRRLKKKIDKKCSFELPAHSQMLRHREIMWDRDEVGRYDLIDGERLASSYEPRISKLPRKPSRQSFLECIYGMRNRIRISNGISKSDKIAYPYSLSSSFLDVHMPIYFDELYNYNDIEYGTSLVIHGMSLEMMSSSTSVTVTVPGGAQKRMRICNSLETVMDLRMRLETDHGYSVDRHYLTTAAGDLLEDMHVLSPDDEHLLLPKTRVEINFKSVNTSFNLRVPLNLSIWDIRTLISEKVGLKAEVQRLSHQGTLLNDNETVSSSPLGRGTEIKEVLCELIFGGEN